MTDSMLYCFTYQESGRGGNIMKAGILRKIRLMAASLYATLFITIQVLWQQLTNTYDRKFGDKMLKWWSSRLLGAVDVKYSVNDPYNTKIEPGKRYIIMSNHSSHYDIPIIIMTVPGSIRMLTKKELFKVPVWGKGMKAGEFIAIDRHDFEQAKKDLKAAREKMESGIVLWIAPEGTRSRTGQLGEFKKGGIIMAIESGATILPVGIVGSGEILPPKTWDFYLGKEVKVNIGKPIEASQYSLENKEKLIDAVRASIIELCSKA
jgi:1-acyl-sn-glycerol-3-phosphate acyltransferase